MARRDAGEDLAQQVRGMVLTAAELGLLVEISGATAAEIQEWIALYSEWAAAQSPLD